MHIPPSSKPVPQDVGAGAFLLAVSLVGLWQGATLDAGTLQEMGPGMLPRALAVLTGLAGLALATRPLWSREPHGELSAWSVRGIAVLGAAVWFALAIRPLGFVVAGPIAIIAASLASPGIRWRETALFAVGITVFCTVLFRVLLGLPIPLAPWLLDY